MSEKAMTGRLDTVMQRVRRSVDDLGRKGGEETETVVFVGEQETVRITISRVPQPRGRHYVACLTESCLAVRVCDCAETKNHIVGWCRECY